MRSPFCLIQVEPIFMHVSLPPELSLTIAELATGAGRRDLADRAGRLSGHYRERGASRQVVAADADALAYGLSRMPATFAAVRAVLADLERGAPDFVPGSVLDAGAGPGTAALAAAQIWPDIVPLLLDENPVFLDLAARLNPSARLERGDLRSFELGTRFDLVTCAYALTELADAELSGVVERLWRHSSGVLLLVEPGRPRDYARLLRVRAQLLAEGAELIGPCPHALACPLQAQDWCHFSVRLDRSREHRQLKQAALGYEDEKFSYLLLGRAGIGHAAASRIIKPPRENKFSVTLPLCLPTGLAEDLVIERRDGAAFKPARKAEWGDAWEGARL